MQNTDWQSAKGLRDPCRFLKHFLHISPSFLVLCPAKSGHIGVSELCSLSPQVCETARLCLDSPSQHYTGQKFLPSRSPGLSQGLFCLFPFPVIIALCCPFSIACKQLFHIYCLVLQLFMGYKGMYHIKYSFIGRSKS